MFAFYVQQTENKNIFCFKAQFHKHHCNSAHCYCLPLLRWIFLNMETSWRGAKLLTGGQKNIFHCQFTEDAAFQHQNLKRLSLSGSRADLYGKDECLIDAEGLLRGDQQRRDASERARGEEAFIVNLSDDDLVGAVQHSIGESTHAVPIRRTKITFLWAFLTFHVRQWKSPACAWRWEKTPTAQLTCSFGVWGLSLEPSVTPQPRSEDSARAACRRPWSKQRRSNCYWGLSLFFDVSTLVTCHSLIQSEADMKFCFY